MFKSIHIYMFEGIFSYIACPFYVFMRMNRTFALFLVAVLSLNLLTWSHAHGHGQPSDEQTSLFTISQTLSNNRINAITQDASGQIWIGTFRGLNKFDSQEYHQFFCDGNSGLVDNQISVLHKDNKGRLWVGTVNGICRYQDNGRFKPIQIYGVFSQNIIQIMESKSGKILINTSDAISVYNPEKDCFENKLSIFSDGWKSISRMFISPDDRLWIFSDRLYCYNIGTMKPISSISLPFSNLLSAVTAPDGNIWVSSEKGIHIFNTSGENFLPLPHNIQTDKRLTSKPISKILTCGYSILLISDSEGTFSFDCRTGHLAHQEDMNFNFNLPDFKLNDIYEDSFGNIWWCSYDQGFELTYANKQRFGNNILNSSLQGKSVTAVHASKDGKLFAGTLRDGIYIYDAETNTMAKAISSDKVDDRYKNLVSSICIDEKGLLWVGSDNGMTVYRLDGNRLYRVHSWPTLYVLCMRADSDSHIWAGTGMNLMRFGSDGSSETIDLGIPDGAYTFVAGIDFLPGGDLIVSTFGYGLYHIDHKTLKARHIDISQTDWADCINRSVFIPSCITVDKEGMAWVGTVANGLLKYDPIANNLSPIPGTPCNDICSITEDNYGNLWVSTQYGLGKYDRTVGKFINFFASDGIGGNQFYDRSSCHTTNGMLAFGGTHGLTLFDPVDIMTNLNIPLMFEALKVHNSIITPSENGCISKSMEFNPEIKLKYSQNSFAIAFTALDFSEFERVRYSYMLEGFDKFWIDAHNNREANYANIPSGRYKFKVRITSIDQQQVFAEKSLDVTIKRPPYKSWWAYLIYIVISLGIVTIIVHYRRKFIAVSQAKKKAALESEQEKKVNEMNMSFFANISHEFRTPLTMISAPVAQLAESNNISSDQKRLLDIVQRNISRMLRLVNQLLDFNKLENDTLKLKVRKADVVQILNYLAELFRTTAREKNIDLITWGIEDSLIAWFDQDKLDKICFNLLSNAIKFTPSGGKVEISLDFLTREDANKIFNLSSKDTDSRYIKITVKDSGQGIPEDQLERIFERYYQLDNSTRGVYNWGTGIGLYYARALAQMHHGYLKASNRKDAVGAEFTLLIPASESSYTEKEKDYSPENDFVRKQSISYEELPEKSEKEESKSHTVLIVDDDTEVVRYMKELLSPYYKVLFKYDADSAFTLLKEAAPDIVISDVVMPDKTGYEFCREIKNNLQLSHIPVILLTAKANVEDKVEGLNCGADAYVTKPFEPQYLIALINSQIKNRENTRKLLSSSTEVEELEENTLSEQDSAFMKDLYELMEREISNSELDVTGMTERLHMSRTKFYYKVKGLTGENPSVFFKRYKLNRAAQLLKERKYNISEIADMTGFSTLSHFSTSFKKQFGVTPSEYLK